MKKKYRDLSKNMMLFSISSLGQKALAFFLVPLYTSFLVTEEYGMIDLVMTTVNLLLPIITLNIAEGVMRFTLDNRQDVRYFAYGFKVTLSGIAMLGVVLGIAYIIPFFNDTKPYLIWIFCVISIDSLYILYQYYLRATNRIEVMVVGSLINTFITLTLNVLLIAKFRMGFIGYYIAYTSGLFFAFLYMLIRSGIHFRELALCGDTTSLRKQMLPYSIPAAFNAIAWWVNSSLDRYFVSWLCGVDDNGVYSMAYKIPNILTSFQLIFSRAWAISAIVEFDKDDTDGFLGKTYEMYSSSMAIVASLIILMNMIISRFLYVGDFFLAWKYVPLLVLSTFFGAMSGHLGGILSAVKDTKSIALSSSISAIINLVLNVLLIRKYGVVGAAIATAISYFGAWAIRLMLSARYVRMKVNWGKVTLVYVALLVQVICASTEKHYYYIQMVALLTMMVCYYKSYAHLAKKAIITVRNIMTKAFKFVGGRR